VPSSAAETIVRRYVVEAAGEVKFFIEEAGAAENTEGTPGGMPSVLLVFE
jgi:hypothetical protein